MHGCPNCQVSVVAYTSRALCVCVCACRLMLGARLGYLCVYLVCAPHRANLKAHGVGSPTHCTRSCARARAISWHESWAACPCCAIGCDAPTRMSTTHGLATLLLACYMPCLHQCFSPMCTAHALSWLRLVQGQRQHALLKS